MVDASAPQPPVDAAPPPTLDSSAPVPDTSAPVVDSAAPLQDSAADSSVPRIDSGVADTSTDAAPEADTGLPDSPAIGPLGSCINPQCDTDNQGDCFCTAQVNGQTYQLGCGPTGNCACFVDQQISNSNIPVSPVCSDLSAASQLFIQSCACP